MSIVAVEGASSKVGSLLVATLASKGYRVYINILGHSYESIPGFMESNNITNVNTETTLAEALADEGIVYNHLVNVIPLSYFDSVANYMSECESKISEQSEKMIELYKYFLAGASFSSMDKGKIVYLYEQVKKHDKQLPIEGVWDDGYEGNHIKYIEYLINKNVGEVLVHLAQFENISVHCMEVATNAALDLEYVSYNNSTNDYNESIVNEVVEILT